MKRSRDYTLNPAWTPESSPLSIIAVTLHRRCIWPLVIVILFFSHFQQLILGDMHQCHMFCKSSPDPSELNIHQFALWKCKASSHSSYTGIKWPIVKTWCRLSGIQVIVTLKGLYQGNCCLVASCLVTNLGDLLQRVQLPKHFPQNTIGDTVLGLLLVHKTHVNFLHKLPFTLQHACEDEEMLQCFMTWPILASW